MKICKIILLNICVPTHNSSGHNSPGSSEKVSSEVLKSLHCQQLVAFLNDKKQTMTFQPFNLSKQIPTHLYNIVDWYLATHDTEKCYIIEHVLPLSKKCITSNNTNGRTEIR